MWTNLSTVMAAAAPAELPLFYRLLNKVLIATVVLIVLHLLLTTVRRSQPPARPAWNGWQRLIYLGAVASVGVLAITAFYGVTRFQVLDGWLLFAHMFGAGAFTAILPLLAIAWCPAHQCARPTTPSSGQTAAFFWLPKLTFWILLVSGMLVIGSMLLSMLPLYGTDGLHMLLNVHRYSGLVVVVALGLHLYSVVLQRLHLR